MLILTINKHEYSVLISIWSKRVSFAKKHSLIRDEKVLREIMTETVHVIECVSDALLILLLVPKAFLWKT